MLLVSNVTHYVSGGLINFAPRADKMLVLFNVSFCRICVLPVSDVSILCLFYGYFTVLMFKGNNSGLT